MDNNKKHIWSQLRDSIHAEGFTYSEIDNKFRVLGGDYWPLCKINRLYLKNKFIPWTGVCMCGKENIVKNCYVGIDRNRFVILGSKCYKSFPCVIDFRKDYRDIK